MFFPGRVDFLAAGSKPVQMYPKNTEALREPFQPEVGLPAVRQVVDVDFPRQEETLGDIGEASMKAQRFKSAVISASRGPHEAEDEEVSSFVWASVLHLYLRFIERSLLKEFYDSEAVMKKAWARNLREVRQALAPWWNWNAESCEKDRTTIALMQESLEKGLDLIEVALKQPNPDWVRVRYCVHREVCSARTYLLDWLSIKADHLHLRLPDDPRLRLVKLANLSRTPFPSQTEVVETFESAVVQFQRTVRTTNEFELCMCSRRVCHAMLYLLVLHASAWRSHYLDELVWLHRTALELMPTGKFRQMVEERLSFLLQFSSESTDTLDLVRDKAIAALEFPTSP
jgi:hypothetical protein